MHPRRQIRPPRQGLIVLRRHCTALAAAPPRSCTTRGSPCGCGAVLHHLQPDTGNPQWQFSVAPVIPVQLPRSTSEVRTPPGLRSDEEEWQLELCPRMVARGMVEGACHGPALCACCTIGTEYGVERGSSSKPQAAPFGARRGVISNSHLSFVPLELGISDLETPIAPIPWSPLRRCFAGSLDPSAPLGDVASTNPPRPPRQDFASLLARTASTTPIQMTIHF